MIFGSDIVDFLAHRSVAFVLLVATLPFFFFVSLPFAPLQKVCERRHMKTPNMRRCMSYKASMPDASNGKELLYSIVSFFSS